MLCVLIPVSAAEPALAETLASLVSGVVSGVVRSVVVADFRADPSLRALCEECGCNYSDAQSEGLRPALATVRSQSVMILAPGFVLIEPWLARLREFGAIPGDAGALFPVPSRRTFFARLADRVQPIERRAAAIVLPRGRLAGAVQNWDDVISAFKTSSLRLEYANCIADFRKA